jgi:hypothetical protein
LFVDKSTSFSTEERAKGPNERVCVGPKAKLYICAHKSLTFMESKDRWLPIRINRCDEPKCHTFDACFHRQKFSMKRGVVLDIPDVPKEIKLPADYPPQEPAPDDMPALGITLLKLSHGSVQQAMVSLDAYICPHLRTSSSIVFEGLAGQAKARYDAWMAIRRYITEDDIGSFDSVWPTEGPKDICSVEHCEASYEVEWNVDNELVVAFDREIPLTTVTDKKWLAKVDFAKPGA